MRSRPLALPVASALCWLLVSVPAFAQDLNGRVVSQETGDPVAGAAVTVSGALSRRTRGRPVLAETTTDGDGRFAVSGLPSDGPIVISVLAPGRARTSVMLNQADPREGLVLRLAPGRDATGLVTDRVSGHPVAGALIITDVTRTTADDHGTFELKGLPAEGDPVLIAVSAPGFVPREISVPAGTEPIVLDVVLEPGWELTVRVVRSDDGTPVSGASVLARLPAAVPYSSIERADYGARTGDDGVATVGGLPPGHPVAVEVSSTGIVTTLGPVVMSRPAQLGRGPIAATIPVRSGLAASVRVVDGHEQPIAGATLRILPPIQGLLDFAGGSDWTRAEGATRGGVTDGDGLARFERLPLGPLSCEVRAPGFRTRMVVLHPGDASAPPNGVMLVRDPQPPGAAMPWGLSLKDVFTRADQERLPVIISMAMDGERANDWMAAHHFRDPVLIRLAQEVPILLTNVFGAGGIPSPVPHEEVDGICTRYGSIPCANHQSGESWCTSELITTTSFQVPRHFAISPDGEILMDQEYYLSERDLAWFIMRAIRHVNAGRALELAQVYLQSIRQGLLAESDDGRRQATDDLISLINAGDEYAVALLPDLLPLGVSPRIRAEVASRILPNAVRLLDSALRPLTRDPDPLVRRAVAVAAREAHDRQALVRLLAPLLGDDDESVVAATFQALGVEREGDLLMMGDPMVGNRGEIVLALIETHPPNRVGGLGGVMSGQDPYLRAIALRKLARRRTDPESLRILLSEAEDDTVNSIAAIAAVLEEGVQAPPAELRDIAHKHFGSRHRLLREASMQLAAWCGDGALLREGINDWEPRVQVAAALGLLPLRDPVCGPILLRHLDDPVHGADIRRALNARLEREAPQAAVDWEQWMRRVGLLVDGEEGDR